MQPILRSQARVVSLISLLSLLIVTPILAVEGRIPLYESTTITAPGSYIVTQDFTRAAGNTLAIAASGVTLDLNGHTIGNGGSSWSDVCVYIGVGYTGIAIRNGRLEGGGTGIRVEQGSTGVDLIVERVEIADADSTAIVVYGARSVEIVGNLIHDGLHGIGVIPAAGAPFTGRIVDNIVDAGSNGISIQSCNQVEVRGNTVTARQNNGLAVFNCTGSRIERNLIRYASGTANFSGLIVSDFSGPADGNLVTDNTVRGFLFGIDVGSNGNRIAGNAVQATSIGIVVSGSRNLIQDNHVEGCGAQGLYFSSGVTGNAYRNNMLRGNSGGAVGGVAQTDAGGNIP